MSMNVKWIGYPAQEAEFNLELLLQEAEFTEF